MCQLPVWNTCSRLAVAHWLPGWPPACCCFAGAEKFCEIVKLRNQLARLQGFEDYYDMKAGPPSMFAVIWRSWHETHASPLLNLNS
jgi:hypothetical protein